MKKVTLTISIIALSFTLKAQQQIPKTVTINTADLIGLYNRLDTITAFLARTDLKASHVSEIQAKIFAGQAPLNATIQRRIAFIADSLKKKKP